jgi:metalloendopeptidase OMA1, mitochondrial
MSASRGFRAFTSKPFTTPFRTFRPTYQLTPPIRFQTQTRSYQYQRFTGQNHGNTRFQQTVYAFQRWSARPTFYYEVAGVGGVVGGFYMYNLETVPVSGRRRFNIISSELESQLAQEQHDLIMQEFRGRVLSEWDPRVRRVRKVLDRLIPASGLTDQKWEVNVIDSPETNAFVIPG